MLLLTLDEKSRKPKYEQILEQVRQRIESRVLRPGDKLPSTRKLADSLGVHRSTVALAYQELWALGFLDLSPGSRPRVRGRMQIVTSTERPERGMVAWDRIASPGAKAIWQAHASFEAEWSDRNGTDAIDFRTLDMDPRLFPLDQFRSSLNRAIRRHGTALFGYGDRAGFRPLREWLAQRLRSHSISVGPDEILITNGSQHAIDLVLRMIAAPARSIAIESPTYSHLLPLVGLLGLKTLEVPVGDSGMDLNVLADILRRKRPALVYTMPNFQNPTGVTTDQAHRERLLSLCEAHRVPILEDGFEEEMKYSGRVVLPVKSMDRHQLVIYCGTFSKVLSPGVRIGWVAADTKCIERLIAIRRFTDVSPNMIVQAGMQEFCSAGYYDRHVARMHRAFRRRMQAAIEALRRHVSPQWARWIEPSGGFLIWLELRPCASLDWARLFAAHGVRVLSGRYFFSSGVEQRYLRLSISTLTEEEIVEGIRRLSRALAAVYGGNKRARPVAVAQ